MRLDIILAVAWVAVVGGLGAQLTDISDWYRHLRRPSWQPPDWLFGPAWTLILALAGGSAWHAWHAAPDEVSRTLVIVLFVANGIANLLWSPLFFKLRRPDWALMEVPVLWLSILVPIIVFARFSHLASILLVPYLLWVSFAAVLNWAIVRLNAPFGLPASRAGARR